MKYVVYNCVSYPAGGLADRLKGLVSCYGLAKKINAQFIINWKYPFGLDGIVSPNAVDWKPRPIQGTLKQIYAMDQDLFVQHKDILCNQYEQIKEDIISIHTNMYFLNQYGYSFKQCFEELFNIDLTLDHTINPNTLGLSCRFGGQQSDWQDIDFDRNISFEKVFNQIIEIYKQYQCSNIFICSDSSKFLQYCTEHGIEYMTSTRTPMHVDYPGCNYDGYIKAFQDFFMLRQCSPICYIKGGFATTAAISNDKKTILIE